MAGRGEGPALTTCSFVFWECLPGALGAVCKRCSHHWVLKFRQGEERWLWTLGVDFIV